MLEQSWKRKVIAAEGYQPCQCTENGGARYGGKLFQHSLDRWVKNEKQANCYTLLKQMTNLYKMCEFRDQVVASLSCLDKHSPRGSCHRDESSMNHTLAQNNLCEFWCGVHPTCKNTPVIPDRKRLMNRSEKDHEESISRPLLDATFPSEPNRYLLDKLKTGCLETAWWFSGYSHVPLHKIDMKKVTWKKQHEKSRYVTVISRDIRVYCGRFVGPSLTVHGWSPCLCKLKKNIEVLHLFRWFTHTHTMASWESLDIADLPNICPSARQTRLLMSGINAKPWKAGWPRGVSKLEAMVPCSLVWCLSLRMFWYITCQIVDIYIYIHYTYIVYIFTIYIYIYTI